MRSFLILLAVLATQLSAGAAPRKVARKTSVAPLKATPLSPEKLRGQITYIQGRDVWAIDPTTRQKHLLFKDLFTPQKNKNSRVFTARDIAWSPDRQFIAYTFRESLSDADIDNEFGAELFLMRWDGAQKRQLTSNKYQLKADGPRFSPDGKQLLYETSSLYRGPGGGQGYTELRIHVLDLSSKNDLTIGPVETSYAPFWSRDGKRVLFSYFQGNIDYQDGDGPAARQTMLLDGTDMRPFQNNWADYIGDNQSRDGQSRIVRTLNGGEALWETFHIDSPNSMAIVWVESNGIQPSRFVWGERPTDKVMQAKLNQWSIEKNGRARFLPENDIWLRGNSINAPTLLVRNAQLIDWL